MDHHHEAEQRVLGAMMLSRHAIADTIEVLRSEDFHRSEHQLLFNTLLTLYTHGQPVDTVTVAGNLHQTGQLSSVGGAQALHELTSQVTTTANAGYYAAIVAEGASLRATAELGMRLTSALSEGTGAAQDYLRWARDCLDALHERYETEHSATLAVAVDSAVDQIESSVGAGASREIHTGIPDLDTYLGGLRPGELVVIAGNTGAGKTTLALEMLRSCVTGQGLPALLFSLELSRAEVAMRMLSAEANAPLADLRFGRIGGTMWTSLAAARQRLAKAPLIINDRLTLDALTMRIAVQQARHLHGVRLVVVDHLQITNCSARALKVLARECRVPVVAVSQLTRHQPDPSLADVPADVAQNADAVVIVDAERATLVKNRHGVTPEQTPRTS